MGINRSLTGVFSCEKMRIRILVLVVGWILK